MSAWWLPLATVAVTALVVLVVERKWPPRTRDEEWRRR